MAVRPSSLENPERDLRLTTRGPRDAVDELGELRERIEAARKLRPQGRDLHCVDCFNRGRDAAIREIEGDKGT